MADFKLGAVVVEVTTRDGQTIIEDWAPQDADAAREYAAETAHCSDVARTVFRHGRKEVTYGVLVASADQPKGGRDADR